MISFSVLKKENKNQIYDDILAKNAEADREYLSEIMDSLSEDAEECEIALCAKDNCLFIRIFDDEYLFSYPIALADGVSEIEALEEIRAYAVKEEIPLTICDIPAQCLEDVKAVFAKSEEFAEDEDESSFTLRVFSEISSVSDDFRLQMGEVTVDMLIGGDIGSYASLCRDEKTNKYWGYNYKDDADNCDDSYFLDTANAERDRGVALSLAVRYKEKFAGEVILYAFDLKGGAEYAIRLLPEFRGLKIATNVLNLMLDFCRDIGMQKLYTTISKENEASRGAYEKRFTLIEENDDILRFSLDL